MAPVSLVRKPLLLPIVFAFVVSLAGCGTGTISQSSTASVHLNGHVFGGQQPVGSSSVQLWAAGTGGNGTAARPMVPSGSYYPGGAPGCVASSTQLCNPGVISDAFGGFTLTGDYTCTNANDQVYLTASQGDASPGINNPRLLLVAVLGTCSNLNANTDIVINEVTTVAAAWALSPFMDLNGNVAGSATNTLGLQNAFLDAQLIANTASGGPATLPANLAIETGKLYALANSIASCVNSDGTTGCQPLFAATTINGVAPTNSLAAALVVVRNPSNHVQDVYNAASFVPPFPSTLTSYPQDWTMSLSITGGGLNYPTALDIDSIGNVWVGNYYTDVSGFSPQGTPLSTAGFDVGGVSETYGLTVDSNNNIWVTNEETPYHGNAGSITKLNGVSSGQQLGSLANGTPYLFGAATDFPIALNADTNGNVAVVNYANSSTSIFNASGNDIMDTLPSNQDIAFPMSITFDASHGLWVANNDDTVSHFDLNGNLLQNITCCDGADGIASDAAGNVWVSNYYGSSVSEISNANAVLLQNDAQGGVSYPAGIAVDAGQNVWVANFHGSSITEIAGAANSLPAGTGISGTNGYGNDAALVEPFSLAPDASGNLWVSSFNGGKLVMFFGIATPTAMPKRPVPTAP